MRETFKRRKSRRRKSWKRHNKKNRRTHQRTMLGGDDENDMESQSKYTETMELKKESERNAISEQRKIMETSGMPVNMDEFMKALEEYKRLDKELDDINFKMDATWGKNKNEMDTFMKDLSTRIVAIEVKNHTDPQNKVEKPDMLKELKELKEFEDKLWNRDHGMREELRDQKLVKVLIQIELQTKFKGLKLLNY
jgi:hypothetical protein